VVRRSILIAGLFHRFATGFTPVESGFCTTPVSLRGVRCVVQKPVNHWGKPSGERTFVPLVEGSFLALKSDARHFAVSFADNKSLIVR
jgi:hypothetical protein